MWLTDEGRFVIWWLLGYVGVNVLLGCWSLLRGWPDRAVIRRVMREGIGPVEAARLATYQLNATGTAAYLLVDAGAARVSPYGVLTAVPGAPEPADPVLGAYLGGIRRRGSAGALVYEASDHADFEPYRSVLAERVPKMRWFMDSCRTVAFYAAAVVAFGITIQAGKTQAPFPAPGNDATLWVCTGVLVWGVLWLCGRAWPDEYTLRWPDFNQYCLARVDAALAGVPQRIRSAVDRGAIRPRPKTPGPKGAAGAAGGAWSHDGGGDACGGGCGGGCGGA